MRSACVDAANGIRLSMIVQREFILFHLNALTQVDSESFLKFKQIAFEVLPKELLHSSSSSGHSFACALLVLHIPKFFLFVFFYLLSIYSMRGVWIIAMDPKMQTKQLHFQRWKRRQIYKCQTNKITNDNNGQSELNKNKKRETLMLR